MRTVLLLPPSETKAPGGGGPPWGQVPCAFPELRAPRELVAALAGVDPLAPTVPALHRYTGVLHAALGPVPTVSARRVVVMSALAGLLRGDDPLPDHRLPVGARLPSLGTGLAVWWRPQVSQLLDAWVAGAVVWDLLPGAYAAMWSPGGGWHRRWQVRVLREAVDGTRTTVSHESKATKGALARHLLAASPVSPARLLDWEGPDRARVDLQSSALHRDGGVVDVVHRAG